MLAIALAGLLLAAPAKDIRRAGPPKAVTADTKPAEPVEVALTDADIARFLRLWPSFERAMADAAPPVPKGEGLEEADVAWEADRRLEKVLSEAGTSADEFLRLYRKVAAAWWSLRQVEEHDRAESALERELDALQKVAGDDNPALREMRSHAKSHQPTRNEIPKESLDAVAKRRAELGKIFGS